VTRTTDSRRSLRQARSTGEILDAAYGAFADMLAMIRRYEDGDGPFYAALAFAAAAAASGRDAILSAPSLPRRPLLHERSPTVLSLGGEAVASELALLSNALIARLTAAAVGANSDADHAACAEAVRYAREIHALVAGNRP
jgi:hypothetical protein